MNSIPEWPKTEHPREVIEAAYADSDQFQRRRVLTDDWARYLAQVSGTIRNPWSREAAARTQSTSVKARQMRPSRPVGTCSTAHLLGQAEAGRVCLGGRRGEHGDPGQAAVNLRGRLFGDLRPGPRRPGGRVSPGP